ncbi:MAG: adenylate/guanylate cyclase domain-containing protein [Spirochaetaceae bacterium]|nr:adenylate/guanylate cyclase domain-containing protein [Spirochaetaceae bacterium]
MAFNPLYAVRSLKPPPLWAKLFALTALLLMAATITISFVSQSLFTEQLHNQLRSEALTSAQNFSHNFWQSLNFTHQSINNLLAITTGLPNQASLINNFFAANPSLAFFNTAGHSYLNPRLAASLDNELLTRYVNTTIAHPPVTYDRLMLQNISVVFNRPLLAVRFSSGPQDLGLLFIILADELYQSLAGSGQTLVLDTSGQLLVQFTLNSSQPDFSLLPGWAEFVMGDNNSLFYSYSFAGTSYLASLYRANQLDIVTLTTTPLTAELTFVATLTRLNLLISALLLWLTFPILWLFSRTITTPLRQLITASEQLRHGSYAINLPNYGRNELGQLSHSFKELAANLSEEERAKANHPKQFNEFINGEFKEAAIIAASIKDFELFVNEMSPLELMSFLNDYLKRMFNCLKATGVILTKINADSFVAVYSSPLSNNVKNAVDAAILMRESLNSYNLKRVSKGERLIKMNCGISYGKVIVGKLNNENTVIGEAVTLAKSLRRLNYNFETDILINQLSYQRVAGIYLTKVQEKVKLAGKDEAEAVYFIEGRTKSNIANLSQNINDIRHTLDKKRSKVRVNNEQN